MPAFSFEKIPAPPRIGPVAPSATSKAARGRLARLVDRLTEIRLRSYDIRGNRRAGRAKTRKAKGL